MLAMCTTLALDAHTQLLSGVRAKTRIAAALWAGKIRLYIYVKVKMQCPLRYPLTDGSPVMSLCSDHLCSDNCESEFRIYPFSVDFQNCKKAKQKVPKISGSFWDEFSIIRVLTPEEKGSGSKSVIAMGIHKHSGFQVVIKAFAANRNKKHKVRNLLYEVMVYEAMRRLAADVPHFITSIASYDYDLAELQGKEELNNLLTAIQTVNPKQYDKVYMLITNLGPPLALEDYLDAAKRDENTAMSILFQILFCLHSLIMKGFQHNDLHIRNILIEENPNCDRAVYVVEGVQFSVPIPVKIYIYDFDFSSCGICGPNKFLKDHCEAYGICHERNPRFDIYTVLKYMQPFVEHLPRVNYIITNALGSVVLSENFDNRMCNLTADNTCIPFPMNEPESVRTPTEVLLEFFDFYNVRKRKKYI
jgi:serine/threonine protein kinase